MTKPFINVHPRIDPEVKARWVDALRSGKYEQGQEYLNFQGKFCCLGVLCDITPGALVRNRPFGEPTTYQYQSTLSDAVLPDTMASELGFEGPEAMLFSTYGPKGGGYDIHYLTALNDAGFTFDQIADLIEYFL